MKNMTLFIILPCCGIICSLGQEVISRDNCLDRTSLQLNKTLLRKKRYLTFPKGSAFVTTITLLKAIQLRDPSNWNLDLEFDMIWPIPNQEKLYRRKTDGTTTFHQIRRHKRELYANIELALARQGFPAKECLLRTICEGSLYLSDPGVSFISDLLRVILSHEDPEQKLDKYDIAYQIRKDCDLEYPCPISILQLLMKYEAQYFDW